uniref:Acyl_transf_3 domain-containing protein n=1 Tax=Caenorhabditis tropicalis TaxID=1561998 RepID=A0A1I7TXA9_9PELO
MKSQLNKFLPNIRKKLYILDSFPRANAGYIASIPGDLKKGKKLEDVSVNKMSGNITPPSSKRLDLQGIRGLAILSVLGFHFYPSYFPNGYLGVDQ